MTRARRRRRRIWIAVLCCVPALAVAGVWLLAAYTSLLRPGRALPESTAVGLADHQFQWLADSNAVEFDDLPTEHAPPGGASARDAWGRRFAESRKTAGAVDVRRGVEWQGNFATYFTFVGVPLWLPLLCTSPLLLVAAWQLYRVRQSALRQRSGACAHCGHPRPAEGRTCPGCGRPIEFVDPVTAVFLTPEAARATGPQPREPR